MAIYGSQFLENSVSTSISLTARDLFIYDTRLDSDGGAWRLRTSHTSWYNETLNTGMRGARREFPVVALITCDDDSVWIYDADDPSFPFWMKIPSYRTVSASDPVIYALVVGSTSYVRRVAACNGRIYSGSTLNAAYYQDFVEDSCYRIHTTGGLRKGGNIAERNGSVQFGLSATIPLSPDHKLNYSTNGAAGAATVVDIAVCIPPNSPINPKTGLTRPRVAILTESEALTIVREDVDESQPTLWYNPESYYSIAGGGGDTRVFTAVDYDKDGNLAFITGQTAGGYDNVIFYENSLQPKRNVSGSYTRLDRNVALKWDGYIDVADRDSNNIGQIGRWGIANSGRHLNDVVLSRENLYFTSYNSSGTTLSVVDKQSLIDKMTSMHCTIGQTFNSGWLPGFDKACPQYSILNGSTTITNGTTIPDRSSVNRDFTVTGSIQTSAVFPNAELRAFSGFSNSTNYISRSHNADDLVGSNDFTVACWFKTSSNANPQSMIAKGGAGAVPAWNFALGNTANVDSTLILALDDGTTAINVQDDASGPLNDGKWHLAVGVAHFGTVGKLYVDGILVHTEDIAAVGAIDNSSYDLNIGTYDNGTVGAFAGHLALPRFGVGALNDRQVAKMYEDERKLFREGAKCILSDSAAYKVSHDDITDSTYVGLASYTDELSGIAVINRESGGAASALDSHDGLVVKED